MDWPNVTTLLVVLVLFAGFYATRKRLNFTAATLLALPLGALVGYVCQDQVEYIKPIGTIYVNGLVALVGPLIIVSILSSVSGLGGLKELRTVGLSSFGWLLMTTAIAIVLTLGVGLSLGVGSGASLTGGGDVDTASLEQIVRPFTEVVVDFFPSNVVGDLAEGKVIPIIIFTLFLAIAYASVAAKDPALVEPFAKLLDAGRAIIYRVVGFVIGFTPYAVLALTAVAVSNAADDRSRIWSLIGLLGITYGVCIVDTFVVNALLLRVVADVNPVAWFRKFAPAQTTAFTTQSSVGTLPVTTDMLTRKIGVPTEIAGFTAPLGTTIGMPGCAAIWPLLVAIWGINASGIQYGVGDYALLALLCLLVSLGTAGVPGTATITTTTVLSAAGLPLEFLALTLPISTVADMARTMTNVTAAGVASTIVARREGRLDDAVFAARPVPIEPAHRAPVLPDPLPQPTPEPVPALDDLERLFGDSPARR